MLTKVFAILPSIALLCSAFTFVTAEEGDADWPGFRGPTAMGVLDDNSHLPEQWSKTENVQWVTDIAGLGWSCPIVVGDRVFVTAVINEDENEYTDPKRGLYNPIGRPDLPKGLHRWMVYCLDLNSGDILWEREAHRGQPQSRRHEKSTYASETPVTDGERVYALFGDLGLYCYDLEGERIWTQKIEPKESLFNYGAAASPVICDDLVIMVYDNMEERYIAAYDTKTGEERWRTARPEKVERGNRSTWSTPLVWKNKLRTEIITPDFGCIRSYDLQGKVLWEMIGPTSNLIIPTPIAADGLLYVTSGYVGDRERPVYAILPGAEGEITLDENPADQEYVQWFHPQAGPYNPSPIVYRDYYYTVMDRGFMTCHDARTGEEIYKRRFPEGASFTASPWAYNGKIFCLSEDGDTFVVAAGPEFTVDRINRIDELCIATPAVGGNKLLIRSASRLYCIGK